MSYGNTQKKSQCPTGWTPYVPAPTQKAAAAAPQKPMQDQKNNPQNTSARSTPASPQVKPPAAPNVEPVKAPATTAPSQQAAASKATQSISAAKKEATASQKSTRKLKPNEIMAIKIPKIISVGGANKMLDFAAMFSPPSLLNYASGHGSGGSDQTNSVVRISITDFRKGKGKGNSVTVSHNIDVFKTDELRDIALRGARGEFCRGIREPKDGEIVFTWEDDHKFNTYRKRGNDLFFASTLVISYVPFKVDRKTQRLEKARAPWNFTVFNCWAPKHEGVNKTCYFKRDEAQDAKTVVFSMSESWFCKCMDAVRTAKLLWEMSVALPFVREGYRLRDQLRAESDSSDQE